MNRHREVPVDPIEQEIRQALRNLPRERAVEGFTESVLRRLDEPRRAAPRLGFRLRPAVAGGTLAVLAAALLVAVVGWPRPAPAPVPAVEQPPRVAVQDARALLEELRREHQRLEQDLDALQGLADEGAPVIYIGGDETLDLVLDLGREVPGATGGPVVPAVQRRPTAPRYR